MDISTVAQVYGKRLAQDISVFLLKERELKLVAEVLKNGGAETPENVIIDLMAYGAAYAFIEQETKRIRNSVNRDQRRNGV